MIIQARYQSIVYKPIHGNSKLNINTTAKHQIISIAVMCLFLDYWHALMERSENECSAQQRTLSEGVQWARTQYSERVSPKYAAFSATAYLRHTKWPMR